MRSEIEAWRERMQDTAARSRVQCRRTQELRRACREQIARAGRIQMDVFLLRHETHPCRHCERPVIIEFSVDMRYRKRHIELSCPHCGSDTVVELKSPAGVFAARRPDDLPTSLASVSAQVV
jgi:hypothetical protein